MAKIPRPFMRITDTEAKIRTSVELTGEYDVGGDDGQGHSEVIEAQAPMTVREAKHLLWLISELRKAVNDHDALVHFLEIYGEHCNSLADALRAYQKAVAAGIDADPELWREAARKGKEALREIKKGCLMDRKHCSGCRDDFYNGHNNLGVKECWSLKTARLIWRKEVHIDQRPPWNQKARRLPSCYHADRYVYVDPKATC